MPKSIVTCEDNMEMMSRYPDKFFELAIVDPPYGINAGNMSMGSGKLKNRILNTSNVGWDNEVPSPEYFKELFRVSKNQIIWGGNYFDLPATRCIVCWDKLQPWENFSQWEMAWTSFDRPAAMFKLSNTGGANAEKKVHPTQKPVKLYRWTIDKFCSSGDKILDTHMGSQSSRIAAHDMGFDYYGCELDPDYFRDGCKRFNQHIKQLNLFQPEQLAI